MQLEEHRGNMNSKYPDKYHLSVKIKDKNLEDIIIGVNLPRDIDSIELTKKLRDLATYIELKEIPSLYSEKHPFNKPHFG